MSLNRVRHARRSTPTKSSASAPVEQISKFPEVFLQWSTLLTAAQQQLRIYSNFHPPGDMSLNRIRRARRLTPTKSSASAPVEQISKFPAVILQWSTLLTAAQAQLRI